MHGMQLESFKNLLKISCLILYGLVFFTVHRFTFKTSTDLEGRRMRIDADLCLRSIVFSLESGRH